MKRFLSIVCLLLAFATAVSPLIACGENTDDTTTSQPDNPTTSGQRTIIPTATPEGTNFGGEKIKFLSRALLDYYDEITVNSDEIANIIDQSTFDREVYVEEKIGVDITNKKVNIGTTYAMLTDMVRDNFRSGVHEYDVFANGVMHTATAAFDDCLWNLNEIATISLDMPWYTQDFVESATLSDGLYCIAGDLCLSRIRYTFATFVNMPLLAGYNDCDIYKIVTDGEWTIDRQFEITSAIYEDANQNSVSDEGDIYGFATQRVLGPDPYWSAFELNILDKIDGVFTEIIDLDRMTTATEKINNLFHNSNGTYVRPYVGTDPYNYDMMTSFASNQYVFMTHFIVSVENEAFTQMENDYGIIPMPKLNTDQEDYYSYSHDQMSVIAIPGTAPEENLGMIGTVIEELSAYAYNYTREIYYELALKGRYMRDETSRLMLDKIVDNIIMDAAMIYAPRFSGSPFGELRTLTQNNRSNWASTYRSKKPFITRGIDTLNGVTK